MPKFLQRTPLRLRERRRATSLIAWLYLRQRPARHPGSAGGEDGEMSGAELGRAVKRLRPARGVTIDGLTHAAEMHPRYLSSIERGQHNPSWLKLCDLATAPGILVQAIAEQAEAAR